MKTLPLLTLLSLCSCASVQKPDPTFGQVLPAHALVSRAAVTSAAFYSEAFDWQTEALQGESAWALLDSGGIPVGILIDVPAEGQPDAAVWLTTFTVPDFDAALGRAVLEGGKVKHGPVSIRGDVRTAVVEDPQGAILQLREGESSSGDAGSRWVWRELVTEDVTAAAEWLKEVLGVKTRPSGTEGRLEVLVNGVPIGGISENPLLDAASQWIPVLAVDDLEGAVERVQKAGGDVVIQPESGSPVVLIADSLNAPLLLQETEVTP